MIYPAAREELHSFSVGQLNFGQSVRIARFFRFRFLPVALRMRAYMDLLQNFGEPQNFGKRLGSVSKFSVPKSRQPFQYDISAYCLVLYPLKQVLIFSFHAVTIRNTWNRRQPNTRQKEPRTVSTIHGQPEHNAGAVRTSVEERATLPGAGADAPTDRERRRGSPKPSHDQTTPRRSAPKC